MLAQGAHDEFSVLFPGKTSLDATQRTVAVACPIRLGGGPPWAAAAQPEVVQCEIKSYSSAATKTARSLRPEFEILESASVQGQPGDCTRDRHLESAEVGTGIVSDVRLPRTCRGRSEARFRESEGSVQETTHRCRSGTMP